MVAALAGGVPVKGAPLSPGVQTPWKQAHHGSPCQHPAALAPAQCYALVHSRAVHRGKRPSAPSQSYRRGGGHAAAAATVLYRRRRGSVARTVSHDNYDYRCCTAAADPYWYRSRCYYRCTAAGTAGYHSRCHCCNRWLEAAGHKQWGHDPVPGHRKRKKEDHRNILHPRAPRPQPQRRHRLLRCLPAA